MRDWKASPMLPLQLHTVTKHTILSVCPILSIYPQIHGAAGFARETRRAFRLYRAKRGNAPHSPVSPGYRSNPWRGGDCQKISVIYGKIAAVFGKTGVKYCEAMELLNKVIDFWVIGGCV